jgi:hypothetical protein
VKIKHLALWAASALFSFFASPVLAEEFQLTDYLAEADTVATGEVADGIDVACDQCQCESCFSPYWFSGAEMIFMGYSARTGGQVTLSFNDSTTAGTDFSARDGNNAQGLAYTPRLWLGRQVSEKWGVVGRFWSLSDFSTHPPALVPGTVALPNFATITEFDRARLYTIDVEAIRSFTPGAWKVDGTIGVRQAKIFADARVDAFGVFTTGNFVNLSLSNGFKFDGTGATSALIVRRQIGNSNAHFFLSGRGSHLWGHTDSFGRVAGAVASSPSAPLVGAATVTRNNAISQLTIAEMQVGIQWEFALQSVPMTTFFRTAFEYQNWNVNGPPTGGAGFGGTIGTLTTNSFSSAGLGDAQLYGLSVATGFTW